MCDEVSRSVYVRTMCSRKESSGSRFVLARLINLYLLMAIYRSTRRMQAKVALYVISQIN